MTIRPRRSVLYMPGSNARAIEKARTLPADGIILDLEDAVAPDAKAAAREQVVAAVKAGGFGAREVFIRINGIDTPWHADDLDRGRAAPRPTRSWCRRSSIRTSSKMIGRAAARHAAPTSKIAHLGDDRDAGRDLQYRATSPRRRADSETRLAGFVMGTNDLAKETRARIVPGRAPMLPWLMTCVLAARAYGIDILDGVYNDICERRRASRANARRRRDMGFDGKTLIHPNQIEPCNAAFSPSADEIAQARKIIAAFDLPENRDKGVVQIDGRMVERMHADMARRTVAIARSDRGSARRENERWSDGTTLIRACALSRALTGNSHARNPRNQRPSSPRSRPSRCRRITRPRCWS